MMTPSDIQNKRFEKAMSGYRPEEVNNFLADVAAHVKTLREENTDLQRKLEILAEKVEQYREDEDSLRAALIGAQKLGDSVVRDAKRKAEAIIAQATTTAEEIVTDAQTNIDREVDSLNRMQMEVAKFKGQILQLYKQHIELIQAIPYDEPSEPPKTDAPFVASIGETVEVVSTEDSANKTNKKSKNALNDNSNKKAEPQPDEKDKKNQLTFEVVGGEDDKSEDAVGVENPDAFPKRGSSRFGKLRFGEAYDLTRKE